MIAWITSFPGQFAGIVFTVVALVFAVIVSIKTKKRLNEIEAYTKTIKVQASRLEWEIGKLDGITKQLIQHADKTLDVAADTTKHIAETAQAGYKMLQAQAGVQFTGKTKEYVVAGVVGGLTAGSNIDTIGPISMDLITGDKADKGKPVNVMPFSRTSRLTGHE